MKSKWGYPQQNGIQSPQSWVFESARQQAAGTLIAKQLALSVRFGSKVLEFKLEY
jgi:hypothetical protein